MNKEVSGEMDYFDTDIALDKGIISLQYVNHYRQIQRPHRKLPALMEYWDKLLKESGHSIKWFSKRIKGRKTAVYAVAGAHYINNGEILAYCIKVFGDYEIKKFQENY